MLRCPRAVTAHLTEARGAIYKSPKQEILGSNKLQGKKRTSVHDQTRFGACEVRFLLPDIRLERSKCTARTRSPFATSYLGDAGRCDLRARHRKPGNARTEMTRRPAVQIRQFRIFVIAELVGGEKYAAVSDSEVDCDLGNGVKSR